LAGIIVVDMNLAKEMIKAAAESGADYAKFQTWSVSRLKPGELG
jgi:sialic acid synthase SpsE